VVRIVVDGGEEEISFVDEGVEDGVMVDGFSRIVIVTSTKVAKPWSSSLTKRETVSISVVESHQKAYARTPLSSRTYSLQRGMAELDLDR
jgi:hypothetical protein